MTRGRSEKGQLVQPAALEGRDYGKPCVMLRSGSSPTSLRAHRTPVLPFASEALTGSRCFASPIPPDHTYMDMI